MKAMSLYGRILATCITVIFLTVILSALFANWTVQDRLDRLISLSEFTNDSSIVSADYLAYLLSQEVATEEGWEWVEDSLYGSGYVTRPSITVFLGLEPRRSIVLDIDGTVQFDNFTALGIDEAIPATGGQRATITNPETGQPVGILYLDPPTNSLEPFSALILQRTLLATVAGGLLTAALASIIAVWIARRIAEPATLLTNALEKALDDEETHLLPIPSTSDEFGKMSAAFNRLSTDLATQRDLRKRLVDDVSHELNTPLSIIRLEANAMRSGMQSPGEAVDQIVQEVEKLQTLVYDLGWLAEADTERLDLSLELYPLNELLTAEVKRWRPQAELQKTAIDFAPPPNLPNILLDHTRIGQAMGNVLRNALQHTEPDGQICVGVTLQATSRDTMPTVQITVTDDGTGIDAADLPRIFERLYRTDGSRSRQTGGSGLGLAITRTIVEAHGGSVEVASEGIGKGTTVRLTLPIHVDSSIPYMP